MNARKWLTLGSGWPLPALPGAGLPRIESAALILRLKGRLGDREPEVLSESLCGLLAGAPKENLPLVSGYLDVDDIPVREAAILALGRSRLPEAFEVLRLSGIDSHLSYCGRLFSLPWSCSAFPRRPNSWSSWSPLVPRPPRSPPYPRLRSTRMIQGFASGSRR